MKVEHDSDSEDAVASASSIQSVISEPATAKNNALAPNQNFLSATGLEACHDEPEDRDENDSYSKDMVLIKDEVSHMAVQAPADNSDGSSTSASTPPPSSLTNTVSPNNEVRKSSPFSQNLGGGINSLREDPSSRRRTDRTSGNSPYSRSGSLSSSSYSTPSFPTGSLIRSQESVYAAVPISSELYIIPKSSRGFHWNGDLFLKPHQRRSLGVDHILNGASHPSPQSLYNGDGYSGNGSNSSGSGAHMNGQQQNQHHHNQDSSVSVHEIRLDDQEIAGILPSWP
ncbi:hypothetical protein BGX28_005567 [Mortierella sp. GBA30]|nr:hypothetical protein BGX28_005567 [Mortierella sp. GBA30]